MTLALPAGLPVHILLSSCGPFGIVPDGLCGFFSGAADWFSQSLEMIQNPFRWLYHHTLGAPIPQHAGEPGWEACQADWSQPSCPKIIDQLKPDALTLSDSWPRLYSTFAVSGVFVAMTCCAVRVVRGVFDEREAGIHLVVDNVVRALVATALLLAPSPDSSLLLGIVRLGAAASGRIAESAAAAVASAFQVDVNLGRVVGSLATTGFGAGGIGDFLVAIPVLLAALAFVYVLALYLLRVIQLVFAVATAPLFVGLAVYDHRSRFVQWWIDLFTSALVLPVVLGVCGSLTGGVALFFLGGTHPALPPGSAVEAVTRTLLASFAILGGVWMTGKAVHGMAWRGFSHGGITGAITAVSTTVMALPNAAGDVSRVMRAGGGGRGGGGGLFAAGRAARTARLTAPVTPPSRAQGPAGVGSAALARAPATLADPVTPASSGGPDFAAAVVGGGLDDPAERSAFNRVATTAIEEFAATEVGRAVITEATGHLDVAGASPAERVAEYTRRVGVDPGWVSSVATATFASLLHGQAPDLAPVLGASARVPA